VGQVNAGFVTADRFITDAKRTPVILHALVGGLTAERARSATDGPDGWSVIQVVCHLHDFDGFFQGRVELMLAQDEPELPGYDHEALAIERDYQHQDLPTVEADLIEHRRRFLTLFESLNDEQLARSGIHPENGRITVFDALVQLTHHDLTHLDQIARCLGLSDRLLGA
jgi:hypothetical protein